MKKTVLLACVAVLVFIFAGCATMGARSTEEVVEQHHEKVGARTKDVEAIIADYADDAVFIMPDKTLVGRGAINDAFAEFFNGFPNLRFTESKIIIKDDMVLIMWNGECDTGTIPYAVDTFIVRNDRIQRQTCWLQFVPK